MQVQGYKPSTLTPIKEQNHILQQKIQMELVEAPKKMFGTHRTIAHLPSDLFEDSVFWKFGSKDAMSCWTYCFSMLQSKTEVIPNVYIGTEAYSLLGELLNGDYNLNAIEKDRTLAFKNDEAKKTWTEIKTVELGSFQKEVRFKRVISIITNAWDEKELRKKLENAKENCPYSDVKTHKFVQLRDLPEESEKEEQYQQWNNIDFEALFQEIDSARSENEPLLIHCKGGRHRSPAIFIAYLVDRLGLTTRKSFDYLQRVRPCVFDIERSEFSAWLTKRDSLIK